MPVNPNSATRISAFSWVPPFAQGLVRDLRARWALEEAGRDYAVRLLDARSERPADYFEEQPWGQVPIYADEVVQLFESGAIVLHVGEDCEALLPRDRAGRARAIAWAFAALNSIEPLVQQLATIDLFYEGKGWAGERRPEVVRTLDQRLGRLADRLGDHEWLEGRFTAGDLLMVTVLRNLRHTDLVAKHPTLATYQARGEVRPAFQRALAAQLADFEELAPAA